MSSRRWIAVGCFLLFVRQASAQSNCNSYIYQPNGTNSIGIHCDQDVLGCSDVLSAAAAMWNECDQSGSGFPAIHANAGGSLDVTVEFRDMNSDVPLGPCAYFDPGTNDPITGGTIVVFSRRGDGSSCAPFAATVAHELGHVLARSLVAPSPLISLSR